jgi:hypothetical protein
MLLNRLMFLYFIQQKGFLDGDTDYLAKRLQDMQVQGRVGCFYRDFLLRLFQDGLGAPECSAELTTLLGDVPYLDSDLFCEHEIECRYPAIQISDSSFARIFDFFGAYRWTLNTSSVGSANEINPDVLGYVFEQLINQQQMGAYYTREDVTEYIAKNTIIPYVFERIAQRYPSAFEARGPIWRYLQEHPERYIYKAVSDSVCLPAETMRENRARQAYYRMLHNKISAGDIHTIDDFITDNLDICRFAQDVIRQIASSEMVEAFYQELQQISILDPTCGAGAFLFAALNILLPLYEACFERKAMLPQRRYDVLKWIITHNLYGVDIMEEAIEICKLRFFLKLMGQIECVEEIEPLPNITYSLRTGNALVGFVSPQQLDGPFQLTRQELDAYAAQADGIDRSSADLVQAWCEQARPFHWFVEFADIFKRGGFSVIIGNPPYVEYSHKTFPYKLRGFTTLPCANLYTCVVERSRQLLSAEGRHGMILPTAAFATRNMQPFIEGFRQWFPCSWLSFYHFRPAMLFSGGKVASIPTAIYLVKAGGPEQRFSTRVIKWFTEQRHLLFDTLTYCQVTVPVDPINRHYYPKFHDAKENAIMEKILRHTSVGSYLARTANENRLYYRSAGGLYWKVFVNFAWPYHTTSNKQCSFQDDYKRDVFVALFNSSLFWWYYTVTFDTFNLKDYMLFGFRFTYPQDGATIEALEQCCQELMQDFRKHAKHLTRGTTGSYTMYAKKSKAIIDQIDHILAQHYGLNDQELDFILHYDIKYRMGWDR